MRSECVCNAARAMFRSLGGIELLKKKLNDYSHSALLCIGVGHV